MKKSVCILALMFVIGCGRNQSAPQSPDSLLNKPMIVHDTAPATIDSGNGLVIDASHMRSPEHEQLLQRFEPMDIVHIYHDYRPLRKPGVKPKEVESFEKLHKITHDELLAILDEGDRLGWSKAR